MGHHYTRKTVEVTAHCKKCGRSTRHAVNDRRMQHCLECGLPPSDTSASVTAVDVRVACRCGNLAYPHYHSVEARRTAARTWNNQVRDDKDHVLYPEGVW